MGTGLLGFCCGGLDSTAGAGGSDLEVLDGVLDGRDGPDGEALDPGVGGNGPGWQ